MKRIEQGYKGMDLNLFFNYVEETENGYEVAFLKGMPGNNVPDGFAFEVPYFDSWGELMEFFLKDEFKEFWIERQGYHLEKYFCWICRFWCEVPGAPQVPEFNLRGKMSLPEFEERLINKFGVIPDAYTQY